MNPVRWWLAAFGAGVRLKMLGKFIKSALSLEPAHSGTLPTFLPKLIRRKADIAPLSKEHAGFFRRRPFHGVFAFKIVQRLKCVVIDFHAAFIP